jgi:prolyl oligopeptidase
MPHSAAKIAYPPARIENVQDTLSGVSFADPYRWLEADTDEVRGWQRAQAALASTHVREWPPFEQLRQLVRQYIGGTAVSTPRFAAGKWFRTYMPEGASQSVAIVADAPLAEGRMLFDPRTENPAHPPFLSWISPSPDGCTLALGVCADGSESNTIRLIEVATGQVLANPPTQMLMDNWSGGVHWLPDSSGFFFTALQGVATDVVLKVHLHRRGSTPTTEVLDIPWTVGRDVRMVRVSRDGRHAIALERMMNPIPVAVAVLGGATLTWRPFVTTVQGTLAGHVLGDQYVAVTDVGASRGRLVAIPLDAPDPSNPATWRDLVPESSATLRSVTPVGQELYLTELVDTYSRIRIVGLDGSIHGEVPLPERGSIIDLPFPMMRLLPAGHPDLFLFAFSSLRVSPALYAHTPGSECLTELKAPQVRLDKAVVEDHWAVSPDGTRIPYHLVRSQDARLGAPQPTVIYAYGGYNAAVQPGFQGPMAAIVAAGAVLVVAHLRGGSEFGLGWWQGGRMRNKQNCYDDLYAVAADLIAAGRTMPQMLAVTGGSNGGHMAGVAVTQRPELWKAVVPRVPVLDLIGGCRTPYGRMAVTMEVADIDDPDEVRRLERISPYHLVRDGVRYPAVYIDAGDTDPRCPPWHARKFAARMQAATSGTAAILVHVWENVGHGWATDKDIAIDENAEWIAFTLRELGVERLPTK